MKLPARALLTGSSTRLPDKIGAFYTFGRKKVGASLLAPVKAKQWAAATTTGDAAPGTAPKAAAGVSEAAAAVSGDGSSRSQAGAGAGVASRAASRPSASKAAPKAVKLPARALLTGSSTRLPDKIGAFYTFGRKKVGASLLAPVKAKQWAAATQSKKTASKPPPSTPSPTSQALASNAKSSQRFIYLMKENQIANHSHPPSQPSKGWGMRDAAPPALQAAWELHDVGLPKCQHKKCNNRALYGLWKRKTFVVTSCERHRTRAGLQRSRPHCSTAGCSNVAVMGLFSAGQFRPAKCFHHASPDMVDARGVRDVAFGSPSSAPPSIWQHYQAHPKHQQIQDQEDEVRRAESWLEEDDDALASNGLQFDGADDLQNSILWASIKKSGFSFLDVLCNDDSSNQCKDPSVLALRAQSQAVSDSDAGRALSSLCGAVVGQLREQQIDAAHESVARCHLLSDHPYASAYFQGELALAKGQLQIAADHFNRALAGPLPQMLIVFARIGLASAARGLRQEVESTNQLRSILKIFPHNCDLLLACAQHVLILGRSKDEAEALLQYAINVHPRSPQALLAMSRFQLAYRNSHFASLSYVNKALQIDPEHCDSLLQRAIAHAASPHSAPQDTRLYFRIAAASQVRRH